VIQVVLSISDSAESQNLYQWYYQSTTWYILQYTWIVFVSFLSIAHTHTHTHTHTSLLHSSLSKDPIVLCRRSQ